MFVGNLVILTPNLIYVANISIILTKWRISKQCLSENGVAYNSVFSEANNKKFSGVAKLYEMCAL